jgi:hypothetical protein
MLKPPGIKRLKLKSDEPLSKLAFKSKLRRYNKVTDAQGAVATAEISVTVTAVNDRAFGACQAGAYTRPLFSSI